MKHISHSSESGVVSIFAVIMFMIFISIISVGFIRVVNDEKRQATDNDLSASAYASAQSGVEDAKRILLLCSDSTISAALRTSCDAIMNNASCDAFTAVASYPVRTALGIGTHVDGTTGRVDGIVSNEGGYEQRWTCMNIFTLTDSVKDKFVGNATGAEAGEGVLIPLIGESDFTNVTLSWHNTNPDGGEGTPTLRLATTKLSQPDWVAGNYPAALRVELIAHPKAGINIDSLNDINATKTVILFPSSGGVSPTPVTMLSADTRADDPNARVAPNPIAIRCGTTTQYACNADLSLVGMPLTSTTQYYLRITSYYRDTHVAAQLKSGGSVVRFNNVQPEVDVTGRTNDVFRRIKASLDFGTSMYAPNFAIDSAQTFCKDMLVTDANATSGDGCIPY